MTASADITVIPTGSATPVDLADLAATVAALQTSVTALLAVAVVPTIVLTEVYAGHAGLSKATVKIETVILYYDSDVSSPIMTLTDFPDGLYGWGLPIPSPGSHTITATGLTSGATVTVPFTV
jgi:hypothetical protein